MKPINTANRWDTFAKFTGKSQFAAVAAFARGEEGQFFQDKVAEVAAIVRGAPAIGSTDGQGDRAPVILHFFHGGSDWWISELDQNSGEMFGLADIFGDGGELGYIDRDELLANGVELDLHWTPKTRGEVLRNDPTPPPPMREPVVVRVGQFFLAL